ncbi:leucine--tRNA ligase [Candidatus Pacearchaeota archaeon]|jgi:leucyl-tRNA synthetase|nr:leucine--tRNA ligase [Candidatus Pacearchaeota archaeon]|tara:strand:- start:41045 stop:43456 length:2412 start_codon:yes stop_codon:yes gene_type:complete
MGYNFKKIETKWQKKWEQKKIFEVKESKKKKYYVLDMFPYPSGEGLHIGHAFVFSLGDIYARFKRLQGYNVLYPIGYDSLGLPAENAAIEAGEHPLKYTEKSMKNFMKQQKAMGWSYDWSRLVMSHNPEFYKWDQWIFLKMLDKGIAYRNKAPVNWCKKCKTVLANEQVVEGKCWRHDDTDVEIKHLEQWFLKITNYAEDLLKGLDKIDWPDNAKKRQRNWIGKSHGTEIDFKVNNKKWKIFTTRPDTVYGVTFMVISAQHEKLKDLVTKEQKKDIEKFLKRIKSVSEKEMADLEKEGVFTGSYASNPINNEKIPIYAGNFVIADYGCGMVMAVPAHDQRDFDFAKKYKIEIKQVIDGKRIGQQAHIGSGKLVSSGKFNELNNEKAKEEISKFLVSKKLGRKVVQYRLKDWLISRQRYWGTPIPIIYCNECRIVPVPEKDLPVELPKEVKFGRGNPLLTNEKFVNVKCPKCGAKAKRETDTMDTFANSSWYMYRYSDPKNKKEIFDKKKVNYWAPVDKYIGGPEHITMHLIYTRFYTKFLKDIGLLKFDEPALEYFTQGIINAEDGSKMSKSKGNVVEPFDIIKKYGADSLRLYLVSSSAADSDFDWNENGMQSNFNFVRRVYDYFTKLKFGKTDTIIESKLNQTIKQVTMDVEEFKHNLAIIKIRKLFDYLAGKSIDKKTAESFLSMLHIYCPYVAEELWEKIGNKEFISVARWPAADNRKINEKLEKQEQAVEKLIEDIGHIKKLTGKKDAQVYVYVLPNELKIYREVKNIKIFVVNDKKKYDPENKSKKVKPGRPGIYLE